MFDLQKMLAAYRWQKRNSFAPKFKADKFIDNLPDDLVLDRKVVEAFHELSYANTPDAVMQVLRSLYVTDHAVTRLHDVLERALKLGQNQQKQIDRLILRVQDLEHEISRRGDDTQE